MTDPTRVSYLRITIAAGAVAFIAVGLWFALLFANGPNSVRGRFANKHIVIDVEVVDEKGNAIDGVMCSTLELSPSLTGDTFSKQKTTTSVLDKPQTVVSSGFDVVQMMFSKHGYRPVIVDARASGRYPCTVRMRLSKSPGDQFGPSDRFEIP